MFTSIDGLNITIPEEALETFCRRWPIERLELFGSVLRADFGPESDIDLLVTFRDRVAVPLADFLQMQDELSAIFGRRVDLVMRSAVEESRNYLRRRAILEDARPLYVA